MPPKKRKIVAPVRKSKPEKAPIKAEKKKIIKVRKLKRPLQHKESRAEISARIARAEQQNLSSSLGGPQRAPPPVPPRPGRPSGRRHEIIPPPSYSSVQRTREARQMSDADMERRLSSLARPSPDTEIDDMERRLRALSSPVIYQPSGPLYLHPPVGPIPPPPVGHFPVPIYPRPKPLTLQERLVEGRKKLKSVKGKEKKKGK